MNSVFNPYLPSGLVHPNKLEMSISNLTGALMYFFIFILFFIIVIRVSK